METELLLVSFMVYTRDQRTNSFWINGGKRCYFEFITAILNFTQS